MNRPPILVLATAEMHRLSYIYATTGQRALLLLCSVISIENALRGEKLGKIGEGVIAF